jgi:iron complex transport system substrate-binding protein
MLEITLKIALVALSVALPAAAPAAPPPAAAEAPTARPPAAAEAPTARPPAAPVNPYQALEDFDTAGTPQRIVSLTPGVTETLFALGVGARVVGVSEYCDHPPQVSSLPHVGSFLAPVVEAVLKLEPDLVITSPSPGNRNAVAAIERAGVRVAVVSEGSRSIEDIRSTMAQVSVLVGRKIEGRMLLDRVDSALESVERRVATKPRPTVAVVVGYEPLVLAGPNSYLGDLVVLAGGRNIADALGGKWPRTGWEFLLAADPEVIVDASMQEAHEAELGALLRRWSKYDGIRAVRDKRLYGHGDFLLLRPGPRVAEQARLMARYLHPQP